MNGLGHWRRGRRCGDHRLASGQLRAEAGHIGIRTLEQGIEGLDLLLQLTDARLAGLAFGLYLGRELLRLLGGSGSGVALGRDGGQ